MAALVTASTGRGRHSDGYSAARETALPLGQARRCGDGEGLGEEVADMTAVAGKWASEDGLHHTLGDGCGVSGGLPVCGNVAGSWSGLGEGARERQERQEWYDWKHC